MHLYLIRAREKGVVGFTFKGGHIFISIPATPQRKGVIFGRISLSYPNSCMFTIAPDAASAGASYLPCL